MERSLSSFWRFGVLGTLVLAVGCGGGAPTTPSPSSKQAATDPPTVPDKSSKEGSSDKAATTPPTKTSDSGSETKAAPPKSTGGWTHNLDAMNAPVSPAAGRLGGQEFRVDKADLRNNGTLTLRMGQDVVSEREVSIFLFQKKNQSPAGKSFQVKPEDAPGGPVVSFQWKQGEMPETITEKYALKLEFGAEKDGLLPGKVYLSLPDEAKGFVAGTFVAMVEPDYTQAPRAGEAPWIAGKVALSGAKEYALVAGFAGLTADGRPLMNLAGTRVTPGQETSVPSTVFAPQITILANDSDAGCVVRHVRLSPGRYLVYVRHGDRFLDWHWVELKDREEKTLSFQIDLTTVGRLEVKMPGKVDKGLRLLPLDAEGKAPDVKEATDLVTSVLRADVEAKDGILVLEGLRPGRYRVFLGDKSKDVVIKPKETTKFEGS